MAVGRKFSGLALAALVLASCSSSGPQVTPIPYGELNPRTDRATPGGKLFGQDGINFGTDKTGHRNDAGETSGIGVNAYLWRGALDTLSFMPLAQQPDPFGGVIITDWYQPPGGNGERFKATAYILGRQLRADGIRVSIFRQVLTNGQWMDAPVSAETVGDIENKVLARARELRAESASN